MAIAEGYLIASIVIAAASGVAGAVQQKKSSKYQEKVLQKQADDEEAEARDRELERKKKINKVLAAQITGLGASGISAEGSPQLMATESLRQESLGSLSDVASRASRKENLLTQGSNARKLGNIQSATTLLNTASKTLGAYGMIDSE